MTKEKAIELLKEIIEEGWLISDLEKCPAIDACEMAIKALEQEPTNKIEESNFSQEQYLADIQSAYDCGFKAGKKAEQEPRWISVSERKPNKGGEYLLWGKIDESEEEDYCFIGDYHEFDEVFGTEISNYDPKTLGFIDTEIEEYYSVVAWMPLPKPYKTESEG